MLFDIVLLSTVRHLHRIKLKLELHVFLSSKFQRMSDTRIMSTIRTAAFEAGSESHYVLRNLQVIKFTVATI